jgi:hypothetical protein
MLFVKYVSQIIHGRSLRQSYTTVHESIRSQLRSYSSAVLVRWITIIFCRLKKCSIFDISHAKGIRLAVETRTNPSLAYRFVQMKSFESWSERDWSNLINKITLSSSVKYSLRIRINVTHHYSRSTYQRWASQVIFDLNQVKSSQVRLDLTWLEFFWKWLDLTWDLDWNNKSSQVKKYIA